jgi:hypothetical protein
VVEFIRREAPCEFERIRSIGRLVASWPESESVRRDPRLPSYAAWLRETYGIFDVRA